MPRKAKPSTFVNFQFDSLHKQIRESINVSRWNPALAISWMNDARTKITNRVLTEEWNSAAKKINYTIDTIQKSPYYLKSEYWFTRTIGDIFAVKSVYYGETYLDELEDLLSYEEIEKILRSKIT